MTYVKRTTPRAHLNEPQKRAGTALARRRRRRRSSSSPTSVGAKFDQGDTAFEAASRKALARDGPEDDAAARRRAAALYGEHALLPAGALRLNNDALALKQDPSRLPESYDAADPSSHAPVVFVALPPGCVRADCGGAYVRLHRDGGRDGSALYQQQGGAHHLYRIATPFVAWMVGRTPYSSTAALVAHDLALRPQDVRAPWSAFDGRRWATVPSAHVRLEQHVVSTTGHRFAVVCAAAVVDTDVDTLRALMLAPPRYKNGSFARAATAPDFIDASTDQVLAAARNQESWTATTRDGAPLGRYLTAEQAEAAVVSANKRLQRESYLLEVRDSGAVVVDLPATCGAAADACAGVYVPAAARKSSVLGCFERTTRGVQRLVRPSTTPAFRRRRSQRHSCS